jgi:hypothetical protein
MPSLKDGAKEKTAPTLIAAIQDKPDVRAKVPRVILRCLGLWHEEAAGERAHRLAVVWRASGRADTYVGLGDRRGIYLTCNYGPPQWDLDLVTVGPDGLRGRRRMVEFESDGNPREAPVQCLVPVEAAMEAIEFFLRHDGLSLNVEWASETGLLAGFAKKR